MAKGKGHHIEILKNLVRPFAWDWMTSNSHALVRNALITGPKGTGCHAQPREMQWHYMKDFYCYIRIQKARAEGEVVETTIADIAARLGCSERQVWRMYKNAKRREEAPPPVQLPYHGQPHW